MVWPGTFDSQGSPCLTFRVAADEHAASVEVTGIIDTGYTGFVLLPKQYALSLGLKTIGTTTVTLADEHECVCVLGEAFISLDENTTRTGVVTLEDNCKEVLIGMDFLRQFGLALTLFSGSVALLDEAKLRDALEGAATKLPKPPDPPDPQ